jgi:DNA polymerase II small subunit/DNA polymerase delta subunit B
MRISLTHIPEDVQMKYELSKYTHNGFVYVEISKIFHGLSQSGRQAHDHFVEHLQTYDYFQCKNTPSLFRYKTCDIVHFRSVDNFGIKYVKEEDLEHLLDTLRKLIRSLRTVEPHISTLVLPATTTARLAPFTSLYQDMLKNHSPDSACKRSRALTTLRITNR